MPKSTVYNLNIDSPEQITLEEYSDVGANTFQLGDVKRAFYDVEVWDGDDMNAAELDVDIDYTLEDIDSVYTVEAGFTIYTGIKIINAAYQVGDIYLSYKCIGSFTDAQIANSVHKVGMIMTWPVTGNIPTGWNETDGTALNRITCTTLFTLIGTTYGEGDGSTTFNIPDTETNGDFIRHFKAGRSAAIGTHQADQFQGHKFYVGNFDPVNSLNRYGFKSGESNGIRVDTGYPYTTTCAAFTSSPYTDGVNGTPRTGTTTFPANLAMKYIIKVS